MSKESMNFGNDLEMNNEYPSQEQDPLEEWRVNKEGVPQGRSYRTEEGLLTEDEAKVIEHDPELKKWVDENDITEEQGFEQFIGETHFPGDIAEELKEEFESFENKDLLKEEWEEKQNHHLEKETQENVGLYTPEEFKLIAECAKFRAFTDSLAEEVVRHRPTFADGKALSDEQVAEQVKEYRAYKAREGNWFLYKKPELALMKMCAEWDYFYRRVSKEQKAPTFADGAPLSDKQIDEMAQEYHQFRAEHPEEFAKMKVENGEWEKGHFRWTESEFKNKKQWHCFKQKFVEGKDGSSTAVKTKYVTGDEPVVMQGESYYFIRNKRSVTGKDGVHTIAFVDIKYPRHKKGVPVYSVRTEKK